jgi:hypothetical protein
MKSKLLITAAMLCLTLTATAALNEVTAQAYEVALSDMRLPQSDSGTIAFKECESCDYITKRVTPETRWVVDGKSVTLKDFRSAMSTVADRSKEAVTILHDLKGNQVTQVSVYL